MSIRFAAARSLLLVLFICATHASAYDELHMQDAMITTKQPDVVADTLTRTERTGPVPLLLAIRHTDKFPTILESITITVTDANGAEIGRTEIPYDLKLKRAWWREVRDAPAPQDFEGEINISVAFHLVVQKKQITIINNNRSNTQHPPLRALLGAPPLPRFDNWYYGDTHFHTLFSDNQAEFGAPVDFSALMADLYGLDWLAFTDHSFDLDDAEGDTVTNDPDLPRWQRYGREIEAAAAAHPGLIFIKGEELSCGNTAGQNVHMLVYNNADLYIGNGDAFEGRGNAPDHVCADIAANLPAHEAAFAAHPRTENNSLTQLVINRGQWELEDMAAPGLTGVQVWNHTRSPWPDGMDHWKRLLLSGLRAPLLAGTDAHGDFNYEYGRWPDQLPFGAIRSAVYIDGEVTVDKLIAALRAGRIVATSGPVAMLEIINTSGDTEFVGGAITGGPFAAAFYARSSAEYGPIKEIRVLLGNFDTGGETVLTTYSGAYAPDPMDIEESVLLPDTFKNGYVRLEVASERDGTIYEAYTNPVWITW